jgi:CRISPR system Cascade subunit CasB
MENNMNAETTVPSWKQKPAEFIAALERLDAGGLARLRRNAGHSLAEALGAHRVFFQALPYGLNPIQEETYFLIATLFALTKPEHRSENAGSFGSTMRQVRRLSEQSKDRQNSLDRRFQALIDSDREQLPFRLQQLVRLAKSQDKRIDFVQLLVDVLRWGAEENWVQLHWSRDYYVGSVADASDTAAQS